MYACTCIRDILDPICEPLKNIVNIAVYESNL